MSLLRDKILAAEDIKSEQVYIKEWDVTLEVRGLTGRQRGLYLQDVIDAKGKMDFQKMYPMLVVMSTFDPETKEPVFLAGDMDAIAGKSGAALEQLAQVAQRLSGLNPEAIGEAKKN